MTDLEKRVARLRTLTRLNQLVSSSLDIDRILGEIATAAAELTAAEVVSLWVADERTRTLELRAFSDEASGANHPRRRMRFDEGGVGWVATHRHPLTIANVESDERLATRDWFREQGFRSLHALPIIHEESLLGVLALLGREPFRFDADDQDLLDSFVAQAAAAIHNAGRFAESESRRRVAEAVAEVGRIISETFDPERVAQRIAANVSRLLDARSSAVYRLQRGSRALVLQAVSSDAGQTFHWAPTLALGTGLAGQALRERRPLASPDVLAEPGITYTPEIRAAIAEATHRALLAVPLLVQDTEFGAISIGDRTGRVFTEEEMQIALAFASQAALALENARLFEEAERRRRAAESLAEVGRLITQSLEPREVGRRILDSVCRLMGARMATFYSVAPDTEDLVLLAATGPVVSRPLVVPRGLAAIGLAVSERRPIATPDVLDDPRITLNDETRDWIERSEHRAVLALPLIVGDRVIGALAVGAEGGRVFQDEEVALARSFADQAALALENARLFEDAERRRREAEAIAGLAQQINASLDLDTILARVSEAAKDLCGADLAWIALSEPETRAMVLRHWPGARGGDYAGTRIPPGKGMGGQVLATGRPFRTDDYPGDPRIIRDPARPADLEGVVTAVVVPIRIDGSIEGLLYAENRSPRPFTSRDEAVLARLAEHAAIAIRNARLLEDLKAHEARLEALLDVSQQLAQIQPLELLLENIARACGQVLDSGSVGFRLVEGEDLVVTGTWGDAREAMPIPRLKIGESLSGLVASTGEPVVVDDATEDSRLLPEHRDAYRRLGYRAFLGVPVKIGERVVGVLSIRTRHAGGFSKEDQALAAAFAAQAATALENTRLFQEVQQAYTEISAAQEQLIQAQKMEAIGRLAGGIAHDFNNLLTIVHGRSEILLGRLGADPKPRHDVEVIQHTALRAAALTRQLLAFSRKQVLQPRVLSLNEAVADAVALFRRLIGEDIELVVVPGAGRDRVNADPTQLEQILINLAVNARDAMPRGGRLVIETANVDLDDAFVRRHPGARTGPHVRLAVSDSGVGMSAEIQARAFEPFFSTKEKGKGTGLGLATVYGIVKQHDGYIELESAPGEGTTFSIYLPRAEEKPDTADPDRASAPAPGGAETILLVEDEDEVRELAREILETGGYAVLTAASGAEALRVCREHQHPIALLLTDVVMPGMSGRELAHEVAALRPDTKVVYMSGYTDDALGNHGVLEPGIILLEKPFTPDSLLRVVRSALD